MPSRIDSQWREIKPPTHSLSRERAPVAAWPAFPEKNPYFPLASAAARLCYFVCFELCLSACLSFLNTTSSNWRSNVKQNGLVEDNIYVLPRAVKFLMLCWILSQLRPWKACKHIVNKYLLLLMPCTSLTVVATRSVGDTWPQNR